MIAEPLEERRARLPAESIVVAHLGRHYVTDIVVAAQELDALSAFVTGVHFAGEHQLFRVARRAAARAPIGLLRSVSGRAYPGVDPGLVVSFPAYPLLGRVLRPLPGGADAERWAERRWGARVAAWIRSQPRPPALVHAFEGAALEVLRAAKDVGAATVLDVTSAHEFAQAQLEREGARGAPPSLTRRVRVERDLADCLIVPSEWVERCLLENGVGAERIFRLPLMASPRAFSRQDERTDGVFRALFVGSVVPRKGVRYLLEAWRQLALPDAELVVVGGAGGRHAHLLRDLPPGCRAVGHVAWDELHEWFRRSDVFVFPSLAEGSALVNYDALAAGLPVITTPNSGSVVRHGIDGLVVPAGEVAPLAAAIRRLYQRPDLRGRMATAARAAAAGYTRERYRARVQAIYEALLEGRT